MVVWGLWSSFSQPHSTLATPWQQAHFFTHIPCHSAFNDTLQHVPRFWHPHLIGCPYHFHRLYASPSHRTAEIGKISGCLQSDPPCPSRVKKRLLIRIWVTPQSLWPACVQPRSKTPLLIFKRNLPCNSFLQWPQYIPQYDRLLAIPHSSAESTFNIESVYLALTHRFCHLPCLLSNVLCLLVRQRLCPWPGCDWPCAWTAGSLLAARQTKYNHQGWTPSVYPW